MDVLPGPSIDPNVENSEGCRTSGRARNRPRQFWLNEGDSHLKPLDFPDPEIQRQTGPRSPNCQDASGHMSPVRREARLLSAALAKFSPRLAPEAAQEPAALAHPAAGLASGSMPILQSPAFNTRSGRANAAKQGGLENQSVHPGLGGPVALPGGTLHAETSQPIRSPLRRSKLAPAAAVSASPAAPMPPPPAVGPAAEGLAGHRCARPSKKKGAQQQTDPRAQAAGRKSNATGTAAASTVTPKRKPRTDPVLSSVIMVIDRAPDVRPGAHSVQVPADSGRTRRAATRAAQPETHTVCGPAVVHHGAEAARHPAAGLSTAGTDCPRRKPGAKDDPPVKQPRKVEGRRQLRDSRRSDAAPQARSAEDQPTAGDKAQRAGRTAPARKGSNGKSVKFAGGAEGQPHPPRQEHQQQKSALPVTVESGQEADKAEAGRPAKRARRGSARESAAEAAAERPAAGRAADPPAAKAKGKGSKQPQHDVADDKVPIVEGAGMDGAVKTAAVRTRGQRRAKAGNDAGVTAAVMLEQTAPNPTADAAPNQTQQPKASAAVSHGETRRPSSAAPAPGDAGAQGPHLGCQAQSRPVTQEVQQEPGAGVGPKARSTKQPHPAGAEGAPVGSRKRRRGAAAPASADAMPETVVQAGAGDDPADDGGGGTAAAAAAARHQTADAAAPESATVAPPRSGTDLQTGRGTDCTLGGSGSMAQPGMPGLQPGDTAGSSHTRSQTGRALNLPLDPEPFGATLHLGAGCWSGADVRQPTTGAVQPGLLRSSRGSNEGNLVFAAGLERQNDANITRTQAADDGPRADAPSNCTGRVIPPPPRFDAAPRDGQPCSARAQQACSNADHINQQQRTTSGPDRVTSAHPATAAFASERASSGGDRAMAVAGGGVGSGLQEGSWQRPGPLTLPGFVNFQQDGGQQPIYAREQQHLEPQQQRRVGAGFECMDDNIPDAGPRGLTAGLLHARPSGSREAHGFHTSADGDCGAAAHQLGQRQDRLPRDDNMREQVDELLEQRPQQPQPGWAQPPQRQPQFVVPALRSKRFHQAREGQSSEQPTALNEHRQSASAADARTLTYGQPPGPAPVAAETRAPAASSAPSAAESIRRALSRADEFKARSNARQEIADREEDGWTLEQVQALQGAFFKVEPTHPNFWCEVARHVHGKTAAECFNRVYASARTRDERSLMAKLLRRQPASGTGAAAAGGGGGRPLTLAAARKWSQKAHEREQLERLARVGGLHAQGANEVENEGSDIEHGEEGEGPLAGGSRKPAQQRRRRQQVALPDDPTELFGILDELKQKQHANRFITSFLSKQGGWSKWHNSVKGASDARTRGTAGGPVSAAAAAAAPAPPHAAGPSGDQRPPAKPGRSRNDPIAQYIQHMLAKEKAQKQRQEWREEDRAEALQTESDEYDQDSNSELEDDEEKQQQERELLCYLMEEGLVGPDGLPVVS